MPEHQLTLDLPTPDATTRLAARIGRFLHPGDTLLLQGEVGAGKTHFARGLIQSLLHVPEDVPSPTFTIVQVYDAAPGPLWHADLYRIGSTQEIEELGLIDAFEEAICLVEWPDRLGSLAPADALTLSFSPGAAEESRRLAFGWSADKWTSHLAEWSIS